MEQIEELLSVIQGISAKLGKLKEDEIRDLDLSDFSLSSYRYIEAVSKLGRPTFVELAKEMALSKPTVTIMVSKLIDKGYLNKDRTPDDGRAYHLSLTLQSQRIIEARNTMYRKFSEGISKKFAPQELGTLIALLKRI